MKIDKDELGRRGEDRAATYLEEAGWTVVDRNVATSFGEIDIIAEQEVNRSGMSYRLVAFVEVKTRRPRGRYRPEDNITSVKRRRIVRLASWWMSRLSGAVVGRFDVIAIEWPEGRAPTLTHYENAFDANGRLP